MNDRHKIRTLVEICQQELMKNPKYLENVSNVPYDLISIVFKEINLEPERLKQLESTNIFYIFEDDELWLNFLRKEYPTHVPDSYVSHKSTIENYYMKIFESYEKQLDEREIDLFDRYVMNKIKKDPKRNKYRIPYRMLFETYHNDVERKQMRSAERLRESVHKLDEERKRNQTVTVDYSMLIHQQGQGRNSKKRRKEYWDDRTPIKSIDKHNFSLKNAMNQIKLNPPTRVAFGGVAGRPLDKLPTVIRSPMTEMRKSMKNTSLLVKQKSNLSSDSNSDNGIKNNENLQVSPRRRQVIPVSSSRRNQSTQNIFLNKKRTVHVPVKKNISLNNSRNNDESKPSDNINNNSNNTTPIRKNSSQDNILISPSKSREKMHRTQPVTSTNSNNTGTKKRSKFFHNVETTTKHTNEKNTSMKRSNNNNNNNNQTTPLNKRVKGSKSFIAPRPSIHERGPKGKLPGYHDNDINNETNPQTAPKQKCSLQNYLTSKRR
ncbi:hypothetical protein C6P45_003376 [Maudiozyma exigua]|uniref:Elongin-A n=1 Tax=Maudiozyma exigua TaxID=34358 RepID=A0A9P6WEN0_MAUEX|nr:hypothetical protein C6P45_003376 [Kazachstania exigua]